MMDDLLIKKRVYLARLYDLYGPVLTEKQRKAYEMHDLEDLSLSEISQELSITRQGISDQLQRARDRLEELELSLGIAARLDDLEGRLRKLEVLLSSSADIPHDLTLKIRSIISGDLKDEGSDNGV
ncbi:MAG: DNA-binding protein [Synergistales bacterium]|nr:DNA-binding protein [Synergistales bacterium]